MSNPKWTVSEITDRLKDLFQETISTSQEAYIDAASVLSSFSPRNLNPVGGQGSIEEVHETILNKDLAEAGFPVAAPLENISGKSDFQERWSLAPQVRRQALRRLIEQGRVQQARAANPAASDDPVQQALDGYLSGATKPLEFQNLSELQATLLVSNWMENLDTRVAVPSLAKVQERIEWETLLKPFRALVGEEFAGREAEMNALVDYVGVFEATTISESAHRFFESVFTIKTRPPLLILAPGGMGKSTLIAEFVLTHAAAQYVKRFPFAYLDFDRPGLLAEEPITLLLDAVRQMAMQFPAAKQAADDLRRRWTEKIRLDSPAGFPPPHRTVPAKSSASEQVPLDKSVTPSVERSRQPFRVQDREWFYDEFAKFVGLVRVDNQPVLLVLDTFEEVQFRSRAFEEEVFDLLEALQSRVPELRTVLAGRAPVKSKKYTTRVLQLPPFDPAAGIAFLRKQGVENSELSAKIVEQIGGAPLTLKLAAQLVRAAADEAGPDGIRNLETGLIARALGNSIQAQLYHRILDHIHDDEIRKVANPGLILRRITPELILQVLAEPCGISVLGAAAAQNLFDRLAKEISLVETGEPGELVHRADLRAVMLDLLKKADPTRSRQINDRAIQYYSTFTDPKSRAEQLYHMLLFDFDRDRVQTLIDQAALPSVLHSINELPDRSQAFLGAAADVALDDRIWNKADLQDWEAHVAREAREFLALNKPQDALEMMNQRTSRTPTSPLYALEVDALLGKKDFRAAVKKAEVFVSTARTQKSTAFLLDSLARWYEAIRGSTPRSNERTSQLAGIVQEIRAVGSRPFETNLPLERFASQRPGDRIVGISLAQAAANILYFPIALESIQRALSAFEQYHGMVLADLLATALDSSQKMNLTMALERPEGKRITKADASRSNLREQILRKLEIVEDPGQARAT